MFEFLNAFCGTTYSGCSETIQPGMFIMQILYEYQSCIVLVQCAWFIGFNCALCITI